MRASLALIFALLSVGGVSQGASPKPSVGKILPLTSKPIRLLPEVSGKPLLNVSEHFLPDIQKRQRVFRYSWKGDINEFVSKLKKRRVGKHGWMIRQFKDDRSWELKRASKTGPVIMESYLIKSAKLSRDSNVSGGLKAERTAPGADGWIWISYNERYAK